MPCNETDNDHRTGAASKELIFWAIVAACMVGVIVAARMRDPGGPLGVEHPAVGKELESVSLDALSGDASNLTAKDLTGHVSLINFWGTWCGPCRIEFPHIVELDREFRGNPEFKLVSISMQKGEKTLEELRMNTEQFLQSQNADFATYFDLGGRTWNSVSDVLGGNDFVPTTVILDRDNTVRGVWTGYAAGVEKEMQKLVAELLAEKS